MPETCSFCRKGRVSAERMWPLMDNLSRLVAWSARREDPSRGQGWAGLLSLHSDPARSNRGEGLESAVSLHPAACLRSGQWAGLGACTPHTSNGFCNRQHLCLGSASPVALALGGSEINGGGSTFPSTWSTLSSGHGDRGRRGKWASVFPLPGKHINKDLTWDFPQRILRTTGP